MDLKENRNMFNHYKSPIKYLSKIYRIRSIQSFKDYEKIINKISRDHDLEELEIIKVVLECELEDKKNFSPVGNFIQVINTLMFTFLIAFISFSTTFISNLSTFFTDKIFQITDDTEKEKKIEVLNELGNTIPDILKSLSNEWGKLFWVLIIFVLITNITYLIPHYFTYKRAVLYHKLLELAIERKKEKINILKK